MKTDKHVCNYALLRFLPYPQTGEFVNVGVLVNCVQSCLLEFRVEQEMPVRMKGFFPRQNEGAYRDAIQAMQREMERLKGMRHDAKGCGLAFQEAVRPRESILRFGEVRTFLTNDPEGLAEKLFKQYVRMETNALDESSLAFASAGNG